MTATMTMVMNAFANPVRRMSSSLPQKLVRWSRDMQSRPRRDVGSHRLLRLPLLRGFTGFDGGQLFAGLYVADFGTEFREPRVERRVGKLLAEVRFGDRVLDVCADRVERAHFLVDRQPVQLLLDVDARLRGLHLGQHRVALRLQTANLRL